MKSLIVALLALISLNVFADVDYPVKNIKYITEWDYRDEVEVKDKYVVMVFSNKSCLERTIIDRDCWLFEKKLDYFVPKFSPQVKVVGFNTYFENYRVTSQFAIRKNPTIIIMRNGQQLSRFEPNFQYNSRVPSPSWEDQLLKQVLDTVSRIH